MAFLEAENLRILEDSKAEKPRMRKKVKEPANDKFASMEDIAEAQEAFTRPPKRRRGARIQNPAPEVEEVTKEVIHVLQRYHEVQENI